jgi:hypothetical protein
VAGPAGLEPATSWFVARRKESTGGSGRPLPPNFIGVPANARQLKTIPNYYALSPICHPAIVLATNNVAGALSSRHPVTAPPARNREDHDSIGFDTIDDPERKPSKQDRRRYSSSRATSGSRVNAPPRFSPRHPRRCVRLEAIEPRPNLGRPCGFGAFIDLAIEALDQLPSEPGALLVRQPKRFNQQLSRVHTERLAPSMRSRGGNDRWDFRVALLRALRTRHPSTSRFNNNERAAQAIAKFDNGFNDRVSECASRSRRKANQQDTGCVVAVGVRELTEVFVFGQEDAALLARQSDNRFVIRAAIDFGHRGHLMTGSAQSPDDCEVTALVSEELQSSVSIFVGDLADEDHFFARDRVRRVADCGVDIGLRELWICIDQFGLGRAFAQFAKDQLDWNPRAADDRLSQHHAWVEFYAIRDCHPSLSIDSNDVLSGECHPQPVHSSASARTSRTTSRRSDVRPSLG